MGLEPISVTPLTCGDARTTDIATCFHPAASSSILGNRTAVRYVPHGYVAAPAPSNLTAGWIGTPAAGMKKAPVRRVHDQEHQSARPDYAEGPSPVTESAIGLFNTELIKLRRPWKTLSDVELATAEYVGWYHHRRVHGETGHVPPAEYESNYYTELTKPQVITAI
ncbi:IS3 family transposase [Streptomyces sp. NPDC006978]|uniref:IS3 family transposase n=1 Tax=unclassified Streptomyces TaxID=2593676 RepID=UPI002AFFE7D4|nr:IS3 family transposase [Streptomyces sp. S584]